MKRTISYDSFFVYTPERPLISSYGKFIRYCSKNNILLTKNNRKQAIIMYLDNVRPLLFK
jgi:hypothetical protein